MSERERITQVIVRLAALSHRDTWEMFPNLPSSLVQKISDMISECERVGNSLAGEHFGWLTALEDLLEVSNQD